MKRLIFAAVPLCALSLAPPPFMAAQSPQNAADAPSFSTDDIHRSTPPAPRPSDVARADAAGSKVAGQITWRRSFEEARRSARGGQLIVVVQELSSPPFAPGEKVRILHGRQDETTGVSRIRIERE